MRSIFPVFIIVLRYANGSEIGPTEVTTPHQKNQTTKKQQQHNRVGGVGGISQVSEGVAELYLKKTPYFNTASLFFSTNRQSCGTFIFYVMLKRFSLTDYTWHTLHYMSLIIHNIKELP